MQRPEAAAVPRRTLSVRLLAINTADILAFPVDANQESSGLVLARPDTGGLYILNPTAQLIWDKLAAGYSADEICSWFESIFNLPADVARRDVTSVIADWHQSLWAPSVSDSSSRPSIARPHPDARTLHCRLNGKLFRLSVDAADAVEEIGPRLEHLAAPASTPDFTLNVTLEAGALPSSARILLLQEMTRLCQPGRITRATLHAGACGTDSACVLLVGDTGSGKSTLCAALMADGLLCYSDDSAVLDGEFLVAGMPFPLMLREGSWALFPQTRGLPVYDRWGTAVRFLPSNLPDNLSPAVPAQALLLVNYRPGAQPSLEPVNTFDGLLGLQRSGFWVDPQPANLSAFLAWLSHLPKFRFTYSRLGDASPVIRRLLS